MDEATNFISMQKISHYNYLVLIFVFPVSKICPLRSFCVFCIYEIHFLLSFFLWLKCESGYEESTKNRIKHVTRSKNWDINCFS